MPQPEFLTQNSGRSYPLVRCTDDTVFPVLLDAKFTINTRTGYRHGRHSVRLREYGALTEAEQLQFSVGPGGFMRFGIDGAPPIIPQLLFFFEDSPEFSQLTSVAIAGTFAQGLVLNEVEAGWSGWITIGDPRLTLGREVVDWQVEPARIGITSEPLGDPGMTYFYNQPMTQHSPPTGCATTTGEPIVTELVCGPLSGPVALLGGHGTRAFQDARSRTLRIEADRNGGELGLACNPVPLVGSTLDVDAAPRCNEVLRSINGAGGPFLGVQGGAGVVVGDHPELNRVIIATSGSDLAICPSDDPATQVEHLPTKNDVPCGDAGEDAPEPGLPDARAGYVTEGAVTPVQMLQTIPTVLTPLSTSFRLATWVFQDGQWRLIDNPCDDTARPGVPDLTMSEGAAISTPCMPFPLDPESNLRNSDFMDSIALAGWRTAGDVRLLRTHATLPAPIVAMQGDDDQPPSLQQRRLAILPGNYTLQFSGHLPAGQFRLTIHASRGDRVLHQRDYDQIDDGVQLAVIGPFLIREPLVDLTLSYLGRDTAYAGLFSLLHQSAP